MPEGGFTWSVMNCPGRELVYILLFAGIKMQTLKAGQVKQGLSTLSSLYPELKNVTVA